MNSLILSSTAAEKDSLREIPLAVEQCLETMDSLVSKIESSGTGRDESEDSAFIDDVNSISKLVMRLRELRLDSTLVSSWLNRASSVQHRAVLLLDEEFCHLLDRSREKNMKNSDGKNSNSNNQKPPSFNSTILDRCVLPSDDPSPEEETFPDFLRESISALNKIAGAMISAGYKAE